MTYNELDISKIHLSNKEIQAMKKIYRSNTAEIDYKTALPLVQHNLAIQNCNGIDSNGFLIPDGTYRISENGIRYMDKLNNLNREKLIANIKYGITTAIAVVAIIISIYSLRISSQTKLVLQEQKTEARTTIVESTNIF